MDRKVDRLGSGKGRGMVGALSLRKGGGRAARLQAKPLAGRLGLARLEGCPALPQPDSHPVKAWGQQRGLSREPSLSEPLAR